MRLADFLPVKKKHITGDYLAMYCFTIDLLVQRFPGKTVLLAMQCNVNLGVNGTTHGFQCADVTRHIDLPC
jgi:hypothetical protein